MEKTVQFLYAEVGHSISLPYLPITLTYADQSLSAFDICFYRSRSMFELKPKQSK